MKNLFFVLLFAGFTLSSFAQTPQEQAALNLMEEGKTTEAIAAFEKILSASPSNLDVINVLGQLYIKAGKSKAAYDVSTKGLAISKNDDNIAINKAKAAISLGKMDEAITLMEAAIARDPGFFMPYAVKANALDEQNKIQLAIGMYSKSIQLAPNYPNNYYYRGVDFATISRYPQAIQDYTKAIELMPQFADAYNMRGIAYDQLEKYDNAIADYTKAIAYGNFNALTNRGVAYIEQGKYDLAKADFNKAISINPKLADDAYYNLANVLKKEQQYNTALPNIEKALALRPKSTLYHSMYASILLGLNRHNEALAVTEKVLAIDAKNRDGFIYKATALSNLKRYDEAIKTITDGINEYPDFFLMYGLRAFIYKQMGKTELAEADNAKAKQLGIKN